MELTTGPGEWRRRRRAGAALELQIKLVRDQGPLKGRYGLARLGILCQSSPLVRALWGLVTHYLGLCGFSGEPQPHRHLKAVGIVTKLAVNLARREPVFGHAAGEEALFGVRGWASDWGVCIYIYTLYYTYIHTAYIRIYTNE